jgi:predicted nucleic acid-binding protein
LAKLKKDIGYLVLLDIDNRTCGIFINLISSYALSHRLAVPDAFIAATAMACDVELFTLNKRDFRFIEGLSLYMD